MPNLGDKTDVEKRNKDLDSKRTIEIEELKQLLAQKSFRSFMWRLMEHTKTFQTIWEQSARIHYNAGQQDVGHFLMGEVCAASEEALFQMMRENKSKQEEKVNA